MKFETIFITEGESARPAAEIQFNGQRLCILRPSPTAPGQYDIEFLSDLYVRQEPFRMVFPLDTFSGVLQEARSSLEGWVSNLAQPRNRA